MKKLTCLAIASLILLLVSRTKSIGNERERGNDSGGHFRSNKTMIDSSMHQRGGGQGMQRNAMIVHALRNPQVAEQIGLSEEQRERISRKVEKLEDKNLTLKYKMEKAALKQARLMTAKEIDEKALMNVIDELGEYRTQIAKQKIGMLIFMRKTLTPEQAKNMREIMHERMKERKEGYGEDWRRNAKNSSEKKTKMESKHRERSETKIKKGSKKEN